MPKARKTKQHKVTKPYRLSRRIVGLTVLVDGIFLVLVMAILAFVYVINMQSANDLNADLRANNVVSAINAEVVETKADVISLAASPEIVAYVAYLAAGGDPEIPAADDPAYEMVIAFYATIDSVVAYGGQETYSFVFVASANECSTGTDGCYIGSGGVASGVEWALTERPWYAAVIASSTGFAVSDPYVDDRTGEYVITFAAKVLSGATTIGYVGIDILLSTLPQIVARYESGLILNQNNQILIYADGGDGNATVIFYSDPTLDYEMLSGSDIALQDETNGFGNQGLASVILSRIDSGTIDLDALGSQYITAYSGIADAAWVVVVLVDNAGAFGIEYTFLILVALVTFLMAFISMILGKRIGRTLAPIDDILDSIELIKKGKFDVRIDVTENNELKHVADAINIMSAEIGDQMDLVYKSFLYDTMTGLKNRRACHQEIEDQFLKGSDKTAFCLIELNNLKNINVTKGQPVGDDLLRAFAERLVDALGTKERVYANGGNEFLFVLPKIRMLESVETMILKVFDRFRQPIDIRNVKVEIKSNIGISVYPYDGRKLDDLLKKCDTALFKAKEQGNAKFVFYNDQITREVNYKAQINEQLADAVEKDQLRLKFQPLVDIHNEIYGFEALVRWKSPTLGEISPQIFIANAEESHLIIPIGTWILREACRAQVEFAKQFQKDFVMSVNVSPVQILQKDFIDVLRRIIIETDIDPHYLVLEITEGILIDSAIYLEETIDFIHEIGAKIALDDFGTGYASLTYVRKLPFDNLKIDKSFVDGIFTSKKDHAILGSIVDLVHNLNMKVIAEGVETRKQYEFLKQISTDVFQGFLFSKPLGYDDSVKFVDQFYKVAKAKRIDVFGGKDYTE